MGRAECTAPGSPPDCLPPAMPVSVARAIGAANKHRFGRPAEMVSALDAWWRVQDLLWRLHALHALKVLPADLGRAVSVSFSNAEASAIEVLAVLDPEIDRWLDGDNARRLISTRERTPQGVDLHFAAATCMARWPEGPALLDEMAAFFNQLSRNTHACKPTSD